MFSNIFNINIDFASDKFSTLSDKSIYHKFLPQMFDEKFTMNSCNMINNVDNNDKHENFVFVNNMSIIADFNHEQSIIN